MSDTGLWVTLCPKYHSGNSSSSVFWDPSVDDLTFCYRAVISAVSHVVFLIVNSFYLGIVLRSDDRESLSSAAAAGRRIGAADRFVRFTWILRWFASVSLLVVAVMSLILQLVWLKDFDAFGWISYADYAVRILVWITHAVVVWRLTRKGRSNFDSSDSCLMFFAWFPVLLCCGLDFRSVLMHRYPNQIYRVVSMVTFSMQLLYLTAILLHVYSSCLFVGPPAFDSDESITVSDEAPLFHEMPESSSGIPPLGEPKQWGIIRFLLFLWVDPLMKYGAEGYLHKPGDLFELPRKVRADAHAEVLQKALARNPKTSRFYLPQTLARLWGGEWLLLGVMKLAYSFLQYCSPLFVNVLVALIESPDEKPIYWGYIYGVGLIAVNLVSNSVQLHYAYQVEKLALCIRGALMDSVYGKLIKVHFSALSDNVASGQVVNLIGTDCEKVSQNATYLHQIWAMPLQMGVALYLLYQQVGFSFIGGVVFTLLIVPLNQYIASKISRRVEANLKERDARVKLMSEALNAIRVIKYHAWEKWFCDRVGVVREKEMETVKSIKYLDAWCVYFWATIPLIMSLVTFVTYVSLGNQLTAAKVFTCLSVFGLVYAPLNGMPWIITGTVEAWISAKRLQRFFRLSEIDLGTYYTIGASPVTEDSEKTVIIKDGTFTWVADEKMEALSDSQPAESASDVLRVDPLPVSTQLETINLEVKKGELVGIIGKVGSGKTSLLNAITAELWKTSGTVEILSDDLKRGFGYVPQDNWIQQGTVLSNIQFSLAVAGKPDLLQEVLDACALREDLDVLPAGSMTQIGDQGVTLSGGQRARIALARAVYQEKEVILMDDPLSAVDAQVANHIFDRCIIGLLKDKTRFLVTHHVDFLRSADRVIVMKDGHIIENGPPAEVLAKLPTFRLTGVVSNYNAELGEAESGVYSVATKIMDPAAEEADTKPSAVLLIQEEQRELGTVKLSVYKQYWKAVGNFWAVSVLVSLFLMQASSNATDWWLSYWVTHQKTAINPATNATETDVKFYLTVYGAIGGGNTFFALARSFVFAYAGLLAAYQMHDSLLAKVMRAKMLFFDTTPSGRVLNRFAKDVPSVDNQLPFMVNILLACVFQMLGILFVICYGLPWFILVLVPVAPLYYLIQRYYRCTSREVKRIGAVAQSPIFSLFSETVQGLPTIRSMRATGYFYLRYKKLLDDYLRTQFAEVVCNKWLTMRLQLLGMVIISGVVVIALVVKSAAGIVGLTITYSLTIVGFMNNFVMSWIETEKEMVSIERLMQYLSDIEEEKYDGLVKAPGDWPQLGAVELRDVSLRYRHDLPAVLRGLNLNVRPAERIGIVGRTGAGKSSLLAVLFRIAEIEQGLISIDGVDISQIPLEQLRSRLAIIPQTPSLFDASIRDNVDPLHKHSDADVWSVIDTCDLRTVIVKLGGHLDVMLGENGRKLSLGQKQLVCLARALLTNAKILCLDEATASIDFETDQRIQQTLRNAFANNTVITIAHRLQTVMDYDRIVVMSDGQVVECDTPQNLLERPASHFAMLSQQSQR